MSLDGTSPIYNQLIRSQPYEGRMLRVEMRCPDTFENLFMRLCQRDPAKGCLDPTVLDAPDGRDIAHITIRLPSPSPGQGAPAGGEEGGEGGEEAQLRLPAFWAHLVRRDALWDEECCDAVQFGGVEVFAEGTWSGGLLWDASVVASELLLSSPVWRERVRGATVLELGCGLALPGLVCHLLGAKAVRLTDRPAVASLVRDGLALNGLDPQRVSASTLEWDAGGAEALLEELGGAPGVVVACDCIFAPLFGDSSVLLEVLLLLAGRGTWVLVASERRPGDGVDAFREEAERRGFGVREACEQRGGVTVVEMRLAGP